MRFGITLSKAVVNSEAFNRQLHRAVGPNESLICRMPRADPLLWFKGQPLFCEGLYQNLGVFYSAIPACPAGRRILQSAMSGDYFTSE
jgi:hypothetical protein